jgi:hypothetical protein
MRTSELTCFSHHSHSPGENVPTYLPLLVQIKGASHLLGDFFFVGEANTNKCSVALNTFLALAETLGVPIKSEKMQ